MKKYLGLLLLLVSFTSFGQFSNYTNINGRYKWIAGKFDSTFTIPSGTTPSLRVGGGTGPGALFYSTTDSTVYQYTGTRWTRLRGTDTAHVVSAYVRNTTASTMTAGQVVYINGSTGTTPTIALAVNTADSTSAMTFGFVRGTIAPNAFGWITTFGPLEGVNTNAYTEGEVIYLDSIPGQFTHFKPQAPYHMVTLGYIVKKSGGNGTIFAKVQNGYELEELHNVRITSPVRNNGILAYDSVAQLWKDTTLSAIGGVTGSGTSGQVAYWTGTSSQSGSNNLFWDAANGRLGIGTNAPASSLQITSAATLATGIQFNNAGSIGYILGDGTSMSMRAGATLGISVVSSSAGLQQANSSTGGFRIDLQTLTNTPIYTFAFDANTGIGRAADDVLTFYSGGERARFTSGGNFLLNQTIDGGQRLQVNGDVLFKGSGNTSGTTALTVQNSDGNSMVRVLNDGKLVFSSLAAVGFPYIAPYDGITNTPNISSSHLLFVNNNTDNANGSPAGFGFVASFSPAASGTPSLIRTSGTFAQSANSAGFNVAHLVYTINQTGTANGITRGLYVNPTLTAAADWRSIEWSNNSGWGLYGAGSANSYFGGSVGIGATSLAESSLRLEKNITGATVAYGILNRGIIQSDVTSEAYYNRTFSRTAAASFTLSSIYHYVADQALIGAGSTVTNQYGFVVQSSVTGATNNYGFYGNIASGTGRWNLYMNGTAANYLAGSLQIGSTSALTPNEILQVTGNAIVTGSIGFGTDQFRATIFAGSGSNRGIIIQDNAGGSANAHTLIVGNSTKTNGGKSDILLNSNFSAGTTLHSYAKLQLIGTYTELAGGAETYGIYINNTVGATNNYRAIEWTNANGWGLRGSGTAPNFLSGNTIIGGSAVDGGQKLQVTGTTQLTPAANSSALTSTGYSVTGSGTTPMINLSGTWNTTGSPTAFLMNITNTATGASPLLMNLQVGGVNQFRILTDGTIAIGPAGNLTGISRNSNTLNFRSNVAGTTADNDFTFGSGQGQNSATSGISNVITIRNGASQAFNPTSGTGVFNIINIPTTINQTGGANGITRGLYINPTLTAAADWRAIETTQGSLRMADTYLAGSGSLAGSLIDLTQTWNTTGAPTLIKANVTNTASGSAALLMDLQVGGSPKFRVDKNGRATASAEVYATALQTDDPSGGTKKPWKLGNAVSATVLFDQDAYVEVEIDGVPYKLALAILP